MGYECRIVADSHYGGNRLTSFVIRIPRIILDQLDKHGRLSSSSESMRAIPVRRMIEAVGREPFVPDKFGSNKPGMQAGEEIENPSKARSEWLQASWHACNSARILSAQGVQTDEAVFTGVES